MIEDNTQIVIEEESVLLPCSFCGGNARLVELDIKNDDRLYYVQCEECDVHGPEVRISSISNQTIHDTGIQRAKNLWNRWP
jgi:Zn finger protein HypA/HybF involved in hydrogenase expression